MITIINYWIKMKNILKTLPLALIVMSFASCTSDDETVQNANDNSSVVTTFTCTQENDGTATKAALGSGGIFWESGDAISIFDGAGNKQFTLKAESVGEKFGSFTGECNESDSYVAVYPYTEGAQLNGNEVTGVTLPDEQDAVAGGFDPKAALMIATSNTTTLTFKNAVGFIKVTPLFDCKKIILRAANKTQPLAGKGKINFADPDKPYIDFTGSTELSYSITLSGTITSGNAYYIAVPAVTLSKNWTLTFVTENKNYMRQVTKAITFDRSKAWNLGKFATDGDYWVGPRGIVSSDQEVDLGLTITGSDGKTYNVIFANSNLTATGLAANKYDFGDYFAWGATDPWLTSYTYSGNFSNQTWKTGYTVGYTWSTVPYKEGSNSCSNYKNTGDNLDKSDDAANVILGGDWQLPTEKIWNDLFTSSSYTWTWITDKHGREVKNNSTTKSIFLSASGGVQNIAEPIVVTSEGYYWSSTAVSSQNAYYLYFYSISDISTPAQVKSCYRYFGITVRPVRLVAVNPQQ